MHPDVQEVIRQICAQFVGEDRAVVRLQPNFTTPMILVTAEQNDADVLATHRVVLEVYHEDVPSCRELARLVVKYITQEPRATEAGMIDAARVETAIREVPRPGDVMHTATLLVDTRPA